MNYNELVSALRAVTPEDCETEARILVESLADIPLQYALSNRNADLGNEKRLSDAIARRIEHEPLQYIVGKWDFYRQTYAVDHRCLIPRPDTEHVVEHAIRLLPHGAHFLDLCTGSGCIAISTLAEREDTTAVAVDKFEDTLELAQQNAELNGASPRVRFVCLDVLCEDGEMLGDTFDAVISNPPYIRPEVIETLSPEVKREPYAALYGGEDGTVFYRRIVAEYSQYLKNDGFFLFEIGYDQAQDIRDIAASSGFDCKIFKDYSDNDRVALLTKNKK